MRPIAELLGSIKRIQSLQRSNDCHRDRQSNTSTFAMTTKAVITSASEPCLASGQGILCVGLPRSGTASLMLALSILGIDNVHHALKEKQNPRHFYEWGRAAWCNLPYLRTRFSKPSYYVSPYDSLLPWTRTDWDRLVGSYRATTDLGSLFTEQLIRAYPEARVIVVERPVDKWMESFGDIFIDHWFFGIHGFVLCRLAPWLEMSGSSSLRDMMLGWLQADSETEAWERMPMAHKEHFAMVRKIVPPEQLVELRLEDGWEPLCRFLDVPIPDVPFPHVNEKASLQKVRDQKLKAILVLVAKRLGVIAMTVGISAVLSVSIWRGSHGWLQSALGKLCWR